MALKVWNFGKWNENFDCGMDIEVWLAGADLGKAQSKLMLRLSLDDSLWCSFVMEMKIHHCYE